MILYEQWPSFSDKTACKTASAYNLQFQLASERVSPSMWVPLPKFPISRTNQESGGYQALVAVPVFDRPEWTLSI
jgi:hypothetical protein